MRAALTHPASKFSKTSFRLDVFVCYVLLVKRIIFKTNLVFWIFLIVVYGFIYSHECEQIQDTKYQAFYQRGKEWNFQRGKRCSVLMVNAGKRGVKIKKMEAMPTCYCPTFVLPALSSHFSVLSKFCLYHEHPFAFSPAMLVMPFCPFWSWFCPFWSAIGDKTRRLCLMAILRLGRNTVSVALPVRNWDLS